ncbi:MAG: acyltransferase [Negativicutes bacterium]|nr:acyltransferase [Negativicutes bacterium]
MRDNLIDALKGFTIFSVVSAHSILITYGTKNIPVLGYADAYMMPLFAFLSGWVLCYGKSEWNYQWIVDKARRLIIPFLSWIPITYICGFWEFSALSPWLDLSGSFSEYFVRVIVHPYHGLWFLWALFTLYCIFAVLRTLQQYIGDSIYIIAFLLLSAIPTYDFFGLPAVQGLYLFFALGYLVNRHKDKLTCFRIPAAIASVVLFPVLGWYWNWENKLPFGLPDDMLLFQLYQFITSLSGVVCSFWLLKLLRNTYIYQMFILLGSVSLEIYVIHATILNVGIGSGFIRALSIFITTMTLTFTIIYLVKKSTILNQILFGTTASVGRLSLKHPIWATDAGKGL